MRITLLMLISVLLTANIASAHGDDFETAKQLIDSGIACNELTDDQLGHIGDYYMEQMHPGEAHEMMDKMMGGEGSESLKQIHINMAKTLYCNESNQGMMGGMGMMNMMQGMMGNWNWYGSPSRIDWGKILVGMMGNWNWYGSGWSSLYILSLILVIGLIIILVIGLIILVYLLIIKTWKELIQKKKIKLKF